MPSWICAMMSCSSLRHGTDLCMPVIGLLQYLPHAPLLCPQPLKMRDAAEIPTFACSASTSKPYLPGEAQ